MLLNALEKPSATGCLPDLLDQLAPSQARGTERSRSSVSSIIDSIQTQFCSAQQDETKIILPKYVYLQNQDGKYLSQWGRAGIRYEKTSPDDYCVFKSEPLNNDSVVFRMKQDSRGFMPIVFDCGRCSTAGLSDPGAATSSLAAFSLIPTGTGENKFYMRAHWGYFAGNTYRTLGFLSGLYGRVESIDLTSSISSINVVTITPAIV